MTAKDIPSKKLNPNTIPEPHAEEDQNTPGDDSGDQSENIKPDQREQHASTSKPSKPPKS